MSLDYIREYYGVPAKRGGRIRYHGRAGVITGARGPHVAVRLDGQNHAKPYHPTDLEYLPPEKA